MHSITLLLPKSEIINRFETIAEPIFNQLQNLTNKNTNLRKTRDLLLPRLISGELDVSELDIDIGD